MRIHHRLIGVVVLLLSVASSAAEPPQLMLAKVWDGRDDPTGWWLSEKYDGVRGYWDGERMLSRGGEPFALPAYFLAALPPFPVDGELWAGRGRFADTLSIVRDGVPGPRWQRVRYLIFDAPAVAEPFEVRMEAVQRWLRDHPAPFLQAVEQTRCRGHDHLAQFLARIEAAGGEGVMLRAPGSPYEAGRSAGLRKHKSFDDAEAIVLGYKPGKGKYEGRVGSLQVQLPDGTRFAVGAGLSDAERAAPPAIGSTITFKHQGWTRHGKPRFPVFWRSRP